MVGTIPGGILPTRSVHTSLMCIRVCFNISFQQPASTTTVVENQNSMAGEEMDADSNNNHDQATFPQPAGSFNFTAPTSGNHNHALTPPCSATPPPAQQPHLSLNKPTSRSTNPLLPQQPPPVSQHPHPLLNNPLPEEAGSITLFSDISCSKFCHCNDYAFSLFQAMLQVCLQREQALHLGVVQEVLISVVVLVV